MKKSVIKHAAALVVMAAAVGMSGCKTQAHVHTFGTDWESDAEYHWHKATCEHTEEISDKLEHTFDEWNVTKEATEETEGARERICKVCNYKATEPIEKKAHVHTIAAEWSTDSEKHWHAASCGKADHNEDSAAHIWNHSDYQYDSKSGKDIRTCTVCEYVDEKDHVHNSATTWTKTATTHKETYDCCGAVKTAESTHTWNHSDYQYDSKSGKDIRTCTVCDYVDEKVHVHGSATTWTKTATTHKETYDCCGAVKTAEAVHTFGKFTSNDDATTEADGTKSQTCSVCGYVNKVRDNGSKIGYVKITGGTVTGSSSNQCWSSDCPGVFIEGRTVTLSDFIMCDHEVTKEEYKAVMSDSKLNTVGITAEPSYSTNKPKMHVIADGEDANKLPVENVSWYNAVYYCNLLSQKEGLESVYTITNITTSTTTISDAGTSGSESVTVKYISSATVTADHTKNGYRLPTEAEWEYAARGGNPSASAWKYEYAGADSTQTSKPYSDAALDKVGWYSYNTCNKGTTGSSSPSEGTEGYGPHQVKLKAANALGLYDMSGNVNEWCWDWKGEISTGTVTDPTGAASGDYRCYRGASWFGNSWYGVAYYASVGYRARGTPEACVSYLGFRVVRSAQ